MAKQGQQDTKRLKTTQQLAAELGIPVLTPTQWMRHARYCLEAGTTLLTLGRPGSAKTQLHELLAKLLKALFIPQRLNGKDPTDMGLPWVYEDKNGDKRHDWTLPFFIYTEKSGIPEGYKYVIVFLDEFAHGTVSMQNRCGEWMQERTHNGHRIHKDVRFMLAANFPQDRAGTNPIPKQIPNRASVVALAPSTAEWCEWAGDNAIHPLLVAFARWKKNEDLFDQFDPDSLINLTTRTYAELSPLMYQEPNPADEMSLYASRIGHGRASELAAFITMARDLPMIEDIEKAPEKVKLPKDDRPDIACALAVMVGAGLTPKNAGPLIKFLMRMPIEYRQFALRDAYRRHPELSKTSKEFQKWVIDHGTESYD